MFIVGGLISLLAKKRVGLPIGGAADPYMNRRYVIPRNRFFNVYCHEILRDDDDRALHDHPWPNLSIVLKGGYREIVFVQPQRHGFPLPPTIEKFRRAGSVVARRARTAHRLTLHRDADNRPIPTWTLFVTGPVLRDWGFWCAGGRWVHWRCFTAGERGELVGAGCGDGMPEAARRIELGSKVYRLRDATEDELRAQRESWVRGEMAIGLDRQEAAARAEFVEQRNPEPGR